MSILIEGMEMPEYCYECPCSDHENGKCQLYKDGYLSCIERPAVCPLKEIKDGNQNAWHERNEATLKLIKRGKGPFRLLECQNCKDSGWWGAITPQYCPHCGKKVKQVDRF